MASVTSLGLHQPTGLQHAIQEQLLPHDPPSSSFTWHNISNADNDINDGDDELLVTPRCVVWSRGGIFRKSFRYDLEKEPVTQALLTSFPNVDPLVVKHGGKNSGASKSPAIVVFLKTQAHIYFLSGTNHVIHLPFEVESALAAANGLIIQRRLRADNMLPKSLKIPTVPPNSFMMAPTHSFSAASSQISTFSTAGLNDPKPLHLPAGPSMGKMINPPILNDDTNWPRLFSLSDPLSELGLIVAELDKSEARSRKKNSRFSTLDPAEEVLYVSRKNETPENLGEDPLFIAVTLNRGTKKYTIWQTNYVGHASGDGKHRSSSGAGARRRSSVLPGGAAGTTTPVMNGQQGFRESLGANGPNLLTNNRTKPDDPPKELDLTAAIDPEGSLPRRKSRRVSSMLARADLNASQEPSVFSELATGHPTGTFKRGESMGGATGRKSSGALNNQHSQFNNSVSSFLGVPVENFLDSLSADGDFEGFHKMGLEDEEFDALQQEIIVTRICTESTEETNLRLSTDHHLPSATSQYKTVVITAPSSATDDPDINLVAVAILACEERRLLVLSLCVERYDAVQKKYANSGRSITKLGHDNPRVVSGIVDISRLDDGQDSRMVVLNDDGEGNQSINLQAPWCHLMHIPLNREFRISNDLSLSHDATPRAKRDGGFKRVFSQGPTWLHGLQNPKPHGLVDLVDEHGRMHQVQIMMQPRNPHVRRILDVCRAVVPGARGGEGFLTVWWIAVRWLQGDVADDIVHLEWSALIITLFSMALCLDGAFSHMSQQSPTRQRKARGSFLRSISGAQAQSESWKEMQKLEASSGNASPTWASNCGWKWAFTQQEPESTLFPTGADNDAFLQKHVKLARDFINSSTGHSTMSHMPTLGKDPEASMIILVDVFMGLHLLREEQKLDTMIADALAVGTVSLLPVLLQLARWLHWASWVEVYSVEDADLENAEMEDETEDHILLPFSIPEPDYPSIYDWIQNCLISSSLKPFITIPELIANRLGRTGSRNLSPWRRLTPRTLSLFGFFACMRADWTSVQFVEALSAAGVTRLVLETLPEAVLAPLQEAMAHCQSEPPTTWPKELLAMVGREDVNTLLSPGQKPQIGQTALLAPSHESSLDVHTICNSINDMENTSAFDGSAEVDRLAITRSIFKDDRRMSEASNILSTSKPTIAHCKPEPEWSESDLLDSQKDHAQMLAIRTLAIPSGRGLLYYSARIPLLTQRLAIGGFNLSCIMRPENNAVGVDKNAFTEEKVCWAFFHAGVATGLSISRDSKGIDSSWILYNKPVQDLSNRHAGFLLALGLNGHLKSVAKWVAFKYLTPKHTITSIGLLLGLAASYIGTMDSLVTRLLSVHVTRMLPQGAAELNLSPLTQTTGIMGIGLLYCNTQHRRMSEIMVSEIEHVDQDTEEEPLRNEGYRLAAGFALGLINLGKGSDLKGLHDMRLTERLLTLASGSKAVDLVHVLDKSTAGSVVAVALIFMKSENQVVARKVDVPDSILQFDYVRPDVFLLRTLARHLIMWSKIEASFSWVKRSLPEPYKDRSTLERIRTLTSEDLPFYDIITGLCFAVALRYAGSASLPVRDLLTHYLDQFMRLCRIDANTYDMKLTRNTVRNCQDLVALAVATVMAGTGDLVVFRRLRSMHGRDDNETPYGSHLAAHLAIGALFLGGGTFTFGTSNLAVAALLIAFYPIFPTTVQDNKSHLQAFRHFWVFAAEARCLVSRDIDTSQPVPLPVTITLRDGQQFQRNTPCLLPELDQIESVRTDSSEHWNVVLDFHYNATHIASFKSSQTIYVRRRPAHDASTNSFKATLQALNDVDITPPHPLEWLFNLPALSSLTKAEKALVLPPDSGGAGGMHASTNETVIDSRLVLEHVTVDSGKRDRLMGLRLLFEWADKELRKGREMQWIRKEVVQRLQAEVWLRGDQEE